MENQKETQKNPQYKYASTREKLCFGIGAIGKDAICNLVGAFLMLYFTDTLYLAPAFVGVLFFVARIEFRCIYQYDDSDDGNDR